MLLSKRKSYCLPTWLKASWIARTLSASAMAPGLGRRMARSSMFRKWATLFIDVPSRRASTIVRPAAIALWWRATQG